MDAMQHYAMARARNGDWSLANAMELVALHKQDAGVVLIAQYGGRAIIGIGDLPGITDNGHTLTRDCGECEGHGDIEVEGASGRVRNVECPWCGGTGEEDCDGDDFDDFDDDEATSLRWQTLDGTPVTLADELSVLAGATAFHNAEFTVSSHRRLAESLYQLECKPRGPLYWWPANR